MNDHQKTFSNNIVQTLYNTVSDKKITFWDGLSKDTNDTRNLQPFMDDLINENAKLLFMILKCRKKMLADLDYLESRTTGIRIACSHLKILMKLAKRHT
jgi:UDPglucose 6-dehydrogenase